jgi:hypothetical protein
MSSLLDADLARLNVSIEFRVGPGDELSPLPGGDTNVPWIYVVDCAGEFLLFVRRDLFPKLKNEFRAAGPKSLFQDLTLASAISRRYRSAREPALERGPVCVGCVLERMPDPREYAEVVEESGTFVIRREGRAVSRAWTVRGDSRASELAAETEEDQRRLGLGRQVTAAWAAATLRQNRVAFYSFRSHNVASRALAESLKARQYGTAVAYSLPKEKS